MGFNGAIITEKTDLGHVYENPIQVLSRYKKAKRILKLVRKLIESKPTNIIMLLQRFAHHLAVLGSFLGVNEVGNSK